MFKNDLWCINNKKPKVRFYEGEKITFERKISKQII